MLISIFIAHRYFDTRLTDYLLKIANFVLKVKLKINIRYDDVYNVWNTVKTGYREQVNQKYIKLYMNLKLVSIWSNLKDL